MITKGQYLLGILVFENKSRLSFVRILQESLNPSRACHDLSLLNQYATLRTEVMGAGGGGCLSYWLGTSFETVMAAAEKPEGGDGSFFSFSELAVLLFLVQYLQRSFRASSRWPEFLFKVFFKVSRKNLFPHVALKLHRQYYT